MATLSDIKRRIKAVKSTRQITKAMKMVAAAKLRKAQTKMLELRPYAIKMNEVIKNLSIGVSGQSHPLMVARPRKTVGVLVLSSDKGLCGAFNSNILKAAVRLVNELGRDDKETVGGGPVDIKISVVGRKARDYYKRRNIALMDTWSGFGGVVTFGTAKQVAAPMVQRFLDGELDEVYVIYNEFINVMQQRVQTVRLLPLAPELGPDAQENAKVEHTDHTYEPSEEVVLETLLPKNVEIQIYRALLESVASEEGARMSSMENATKSATEMINTLSLQYNKARQASITAELMDIVGGVEALKQG